MNTTTRPIRFKSLPQFFEKEKDGRKPNTYREVDPDDPRFWDLQLLHDNPHIQAMVEIENTDTAEIFAREIQDISYFKPRVVGPTWVIVSWKHKEDT